MLALTLGLTSARAAEFGIGAFGGVSIPIANDLSEQGSQFGIRVPVKLSSLFTIEPYWSTSALGEVEDTFGGPTTYTRDGGDVQSFGANALFTFGTGVQFSPFAGLGSYGLERDGAVQAASVERGGPASRAGLEQGDIIVGFAGQPVAGFDDLHRLLTEEKLGSRVSITVLRRGQRLTLEIHPEEFR